MSLSPTQLDFSKLQPINPPKAAPPPQSGGGGVQLDFGKMQPINGAPAPSATTSAPAATDTYQPSFLDRAGNILGSIGHSISNLVSPPGAIPNDGSDPKGYIKQQLDDQNNEIRGLLKSVYEGIHTLAKHAAFPIPGTDPIKVGNDTAASLDSIVTKHIPFLTQQTTDPRAQATEQRGALVENLLEFYLGGEALKGMSLTEKLKQAGKIGQLIEKYPGIARTVGTVAEQGALGTGQAALHGADTEDALISGGITGATAGLLEGAGQGVKAVTEKIAPTTRAIAGEEIPALASQKPGAGAAAKTAATIADEPEFQTAQQQGSEKAIGNIAQQAARKSLDELNTMRASVVAPLDRRLPAPEGSQPFRFTIEGTPTEFSTEGGGSAAEPRKKQIGTEFVAGKGSGTAPKVEPFEAGTFQNGEQPPLAPVRDTEPFAARGHKEPVWQYLTDTKPGSAEPATEKLGGGGVLQTEDPHLASATLGQLQTIADGAGFENLSPTAQGKIKASIQSLIDQLHEYHNNAYKQAIPHFPPVDTEAAASQVHSFGDLEAQLQHAVQPVYSKLDDVSAGEWGALRKQQIALQKIAKNPTSPEAYDNALTRKAQVEAKMQGIFDSNPEDVAPQEWRAANRQWRRASTAADLDAVIEGMSNGITRDAAARLANSGDTFDQGIVRKLKGGTPANRRLQTLLSKRGEDVTDLIGQDGIDNLYRINDLLKTPEKAAGFAKLLQGIGMVMRRYGTGVGAMAGAGVAHGVGAVFGHAVSPYGGMLAGAATEAGVRRALNAVATNPEVAARIVYAVDNNVSPRVAAPIIATMMLGGVKKDQPSQPQEGQQ